MKDLKFCHFMSMSHFVSFAFSRFEENVRFQKISISKKKLLEGNPNQLFTVGGLIFSNCTYLYVIFDQ